MSTVVNTHCLRTAAITSSSGVSKCSGKLDGGFSSGMFGGLNESRKLPVCVTICQLPIEDVDSCRWRAEAAPRGIGTDPELKLFMFVQVLFFN